MEIFDVFSMNGIENYPAAGEIFLENVILKVSQTHFPKDLYPKGYKSLHMLKTLHRPNSRLQYCTTHFNKINGGSKELSMKCPLDHSYSPSSYVTSVYCLL